MSRDDFDPEAGWTSEGLGWLLTFQTRPEGIDELPKGAGPGTAGEALRQHFQECFARLDEMIPDGVRIATRLKIIGCASLVGRENGCQQLKDRVEAEGFATMCKNLRCLVGT